MESREIMVANTKTQKRFKIMSAATTLGELKHDLDAQNIDYSGMSFTEGIANVQLNDDSSLLPTNLNYKGHITNSLVILLTNSTKNIASGTMSRKEAYALIKGNAELQKAILDTYGRNYTQVSTDNLLQVIGANDTESQPESLIDEIGNEVINAYNTRTRENAPRKNDKEDLISAIIEVITTFYAFDALDDDDLSDIVEGIQNLSA